MLVFMWLKSTDQLAQGHAVHVLNFKSVELFKKHFVESRSRYPGMVILKYVVPIPHRALDCLTTGCYSTDHLASTIYIILPP